MTIPFFPYKLFLLYLEPIATIGGAYYAGLLPNAYIKDIVPNSNTPYSVLTTPVLMTLYQLGNMYMLAGITEHLVLSSTENIKSWKRFLCALLVAYFGHLMTMSPLGLDAYWKFWEWNAMMWGSVAMVYVGAAIRLSFLFGLGLSRPAESPERAKKA